MQVNVVIKMKDDEQNVLVTKNQMSMKEARAFAKDYDKTNVLWIKARYFDGWHRRYKPLWEGTK